MGGRYLDCICWLKLTTLSRFVCGLSWCFQTNVRLLSCWKKSQPAFCISSFIAFASSSVILQLVTVNQSLTWVFHWLTRWQWNINHLLLCWQIDTYLPTFYTKKLLWHAEHLSRMSVATLVLYKYKYVLFTFPELQFRMSDMMTGHIH